MYDGKCVMMIIKEINSRKLIITIHIFFHPFTPDYRGYLYTYIHHTYTNSGGKKLTTIIACVRRRMTWEHGVWAGGGFEGLNSDRITPGGVYPSIIISPIRND